MVNSKEIPIDEIKSVNDVADAYAKLGLKIKQPIKEDCIVPSAQNETL